eukprot:225353-Chlamydomonas_euryale.AAC.1
MHQDRCSVWGSRCTRTGVKCGDQDAPGQVFGVGMLIDDVLFQKMDETARQHDALAHFVCPIGALQALPTRGLEAVVAFVAARQPDLPTRSGADASGGTGGTGAAAADVAVPAGTPK